MIKRIAAAFSLVAILSLSIIAVVYASDISDAEYYGVISASNTGTAATRVACTVTGLDTQVLIDDGYVNSSVSNTVLRNSSGADIAFMPGYTTNPWCIWVGDIDADSQRSYTLYTGATGGLMRYFPDSGGMTTPDAASLELGSDFKIEQKGYIGTSSGSSKNLVYKYGAVVIYISGTGAISANVTGTVLITATGISSGDKTVTVEADPLLWAPYDALHFDGSATSIINCGAIHNASAKLGLSIWFKLDDAFSAGAATDIYLFQKSFGGVYHQLFLQNSNGKLCLDTNVFALSSDETSWAADTWYHVYIGLGQATGGGAASDGARMRINNGTAKTNADASAVANGGDFRLGSRGNPDSLVGHLANVTVMTDDVTAAEETALYNGTPPGDENNLWYVDEGTGTTIIDYGGDGDDGTAGANTSWGTPTRPCKFTISVDGTAEAGFARPVSVTNNANNWAFLQNDSMLYMESHQIWVMDALVQDIEWEYDTTFTDQSGNSNDATPTFRSSSSDLDVTATLYSFTPVSESKAPAFSLGDAPDFITSTPAISGNFSTTPSPTFPGKDAIDAIANASSTPSQLPYMLIVGFATIATSLTTSWLMRKYGSGTLLVKIFVIVAAMGILTAVQVNDFWMLLFFLIIGGAIAMASRQVSW